MPKSSSLALVALTAALLGAAPADAPLAVSSWVYVGADQRLHYKTDGQGNRILDFSFAGYGGGGVALPIVPTTKTLSPVAGDNTAAIQAAIDATSNLTPDANGLRGAVLLGPGTFAVNGPLSLAASGVVVRGSGSGAGGTVLDLTSGAAHLAFQIGGTGSWKASGAAAHIVSSYVPSGAMSFTVDDGTNFQVGDAVLVGRPVTQPWVHLMGMDTLTGTSGPQTWIGVGSVIQTDRAIAAIHGNEITLDAPVADSFDATYLSPPGATLTKYTFPGRVSNVGLEHLKVIAAAVNVPIASPQYRGAELDAVLDGWIDDVAFQDTQNTIVVGNAAKRITIRNVHVTHTVDHTGDRMADFGLSGTQVLVDQSSSNGTGEWPLLTQGEVSGPIVALNFSSSQLAGIGPHQRWAVGLLTDGATLPNAPNNPDGGATGISYSDRGNHGSGQGWAMGWGVAWNVTSPYLVVQQPPGSNNWCIGCIGKEVTAVEAGSGKMVPNGIFESLGTKVTPNSLYLAQLCDRLGTAAVEAVGYTANDCAVAGGGSADGGTPLGDAGSPGPLPGVDAGAEPPGGMGPGSTSGGSSGGGGGSGSSGGGGGSTNGASSGSATAASSGCACTVAHSGGVASLPAWPTSVGVLGLAIARRRRRRSGTIAD